MSNATFYGHPPPRKEEGGEGGRYAPSEAIAGGLDATLADPTRPRPIQRMQVSMHRNAVDT